MDSELAFQDMLQGEYEIAFSCIVSLFVWLLTSSYGLVGLVGLVVKESILWLFYDWWNEPKDSIGYLLSGQHSILNFFISKKAK